MRTSRPGRRPTPIRGATPLRRGPRVRRASARLSPVRAGAALAVLAAVLAIVGLTGSEAFGLDRLDIDGDHWTARAKVESAIAVSPGTNLFQVRTEPVEAALEALPAVADATVDIALPDTLVIRIQEREPILVWRIGDRRLLVDRSGRLFDEPGDTSVAGLSGLPVVDDRRDAAARLTVGSTLDPVDLDAATRLAALRPTDVGSVAASLAVRITEANGFVVLARPDGWSAIFGFYTPSLRTTEMVPGQVRLLRSLLNGREATVQRVILASETDGTYVLRPAASPTPTAKP